MTTTHDDELQTAIRVVQDAGFDIVIHEQHVQLRQWIDAGGAGWPYSGWKMGMPLVERRSSLLSLHSVSRCDNVKFLQLQGLLNCVRRPGHYGEHWDGSDQRWE